jgi:hypothetical protein
MGQKPARAAIRFAKSVAVLSLVMCAGVRVSLAGEPELPKGVGPLPDLSKGVKAGAIVTSQHAHLYRMLLPPELAPMLDRGELAFEAVGAPREPARFVTQRASAETVATLTQSGSIQDPSGGKAMVSPVFEPPRSASGDLSQVGYKVLWNAASLSWRHDSLSVASSALIFKSSEDSPHKLEFNVERTHPRKIGEVTGTLEPVFRERISARKPAAIENLSWLTLRFFGSGEDFLWAASPVINQIRQMTGSNRSDAMFTGIFAPDDLFVWSGKVELVEPSGLALVPMLVPMLETKEVKAEPRERCQMWSLRGDAGVTLNYQSSRFKGAGAWIPTNTVMALRSVWRIELATRDPFSLDARQTLYVDRDTGLPVYRVVWDEAGRLRKLSLGILRSLQREGTQPEPIIAGQVLIHGAGAGRLVMTTDAFATCAGYPPARSKADFDPSSFVRFSAPQTGTQKKLEQAKDSEDSSD